MKEKLHIRTFVLGEFAANCFVMWIKPDSACIIDPGANAEKIIDFLNVKKMKISYYLLTHGHMDHISALYDLAKMFPAPYYLHKNDFSWAFTEQNAWEPFYAMPQQPENTNISVINEASSIKWNEIQIKILHTPGHTNGSVCFYIEEHNKCFTGDTIFKGSVGRTDLPGGSALLQAKSLKNICMLSSDTILYPGHGPITSVKEEKAYNPFLISFAQDI